MNQEQPMMNASDLASAPPARLPFPITRAVAEPVAAEAADSGSLPTMVGHFSTFGDWYEVNSLLEGRFLERVSPGSFRKTIAESIGSMKVLFDHGQDPQIGNKVLGPIDDLREDRTGPAYRVPLFDTSYNRDLAPGLEAGVYGSSFRFTVEKDGWDQTPDVSDHNPEGIPERTITEARVYEFGPVTFPANPNATAGVRSTTDDYYERSRDAEAFGELVRSAITARTPRGAATPSSEPPADTPLEPSRPDTPRTMTSTSTSDYILDLSGRGYLVGEHGPGIFTPVTAGAIEPLAAPEETPPMDYQTLDEKGARVRELQADLAAIAADHTGVLPDDVQVRWDAATAEQDALERDIEAVKARDARLARAAADPTKTPPPEQYAVPTIIKAIDIFDTVRLEREAKSEEDRSQKYRDYAMRAAEQMTVASPRYDQDKSRERLQQLVEYHDSDDKEIARRVLATNSPQYRAAFNRYVRSGGEERGTALAVGVDATGGYAVPVSFDPTVIAIGAWTAINPYRAACRTVTISGTDTWQALTATAITAAYAAEAAAATEQGPTFARPEFVAKRAHAFVTASYEMAQDRADLASELGTLFGEAKDTLEENQFSIGVGTTVYPQGMGLKDAYTRVDTVTNDVFAVADVRAMEAGLPIRHRFNAAWFLSRAAIRGIQAFETTGGQLFNGTNYAAVGNPATNRTGNTGLTLLGYPVWETPSMPYTPTTDDTTWGVLANPDTYVIVDRVGMSVRVIPDMLNGATPSFPTGEIGIYAFWRNTARVLNVDGGRQGGIQ